MKSKYLNMQEKPKERNKLIEWGTKGMTPLGWVWFTLWVMWVIAHALGI